MLYLLHPIVIGVTNLANDLGHHLAGFIPLYDRKLKYYMQVVAAETPPTGHVRGVLVVQALSIGD